MSELKPCPFCGGESEMGYVYYEGPVAPAPLPRCKKMGCIGYSHLEFHDADEVAIAAWNTRPIEAELRARIKELEARVESLQEWYEQEIKETKNINSINGVFREILKSRYLRAIDLLDKFCKVKNENRKL